MNPALCVLTMAVGGMLVVGAVLGYVTGWLGTGAAVALGEGMRVTPQRVGAAELNIHKLARRIPLGDFRAPAQGKAMHANPVINQRAALHHDGAGCQDFE